MDADWAASTDENGVAASGPKDWHTVEFMARQPG